MTRKKLPKIKVDGISTDDLRRLRSATREVWRWSHPRNLVVKRCVKDDGFSYCEMCGLKSPKVFIDHITAVGDILDDGYIKRLFCSSNKLQGLCHECHKPKTKLENKVARARRKAKKSDGNDFY